MAEPLSRPPGGGRPRFSRPRPARVYAGRGGGAASPPAGPRARALRAPRPSPRPRQHATALRVPRAVARPRREPLSLLAPPRRSAPRLPHLLPPAAHRARAPPAERAPAARRQPPQLPRPVRDRHARAPPRLLHGQARALREALAGLAAEWARCL